MLIQFRFNNFRSFKNDAVFNMEASPISDFNDRPYSIAKSKVSPKILTCAAIYGANASGKSNLLDAFKFMKSFVENSYSVDLNSSTSETSLFHNDKCCSYTPFLFDKSSKNRNSEFEVYFYVEEQKRIFNYGFRIENNKLVEEWFNTLPRTSDNVKEIFYREYDHLELPGLNKTQQKLIKSSFKPETLILTLGHILKIPILNTAYNWFREIQFLSSESLKEFLENITSNLISDDFVNNLNEAQDFLSLFDPTIVDLVINDSDGEKRLYCIHENLKGNQISFLFDDESAGTKKMFSLFFYLSKALLNGGILVIDDLNSQLHPLLHRLVILLFVNKETNPNHTQLIFTTHDTTFLSNELFRRDEIWFIDKNSDGKSELYPLYNVIDEDNNRVRKDETFNKNYLKGEYGAVPHFKEFIINNEEGDSNK